MKKLSLFTFISAFILSAPAYAVSKDISSPNVTEGQIAIKDKGYIEMDKDKDSRWINKTTLEYGLTDRLQIAVDGEIEKKEDESVEYKKTKLKTKFKLTGDDYFLKSALQLSYAKNHLGDADEVEAKLIFQKTYGQWDQRANVQISHEVGDDKASGAEAALKLGSYYKMNGFKLGGEYIVDFGNLKEQDGYSNQEHHIGPVVGFDIPLGQSKIGTKIGYLAGISKASPDHVIKYELEYAF